MKIPGDYSSTKTAEVYPSSVTNKEGQILFGLSNVTGNPADQLVYRIARHSRDFSYILDQPYPISERSESEFVLSSIEIGGMLAVGQLIYVAWKNGSSYGVDKLDASNKLSGAYFETRVQAQNREEFSNFAKTLVAYASLPASTNVDFYLDINYADYGSALSKVADTQRNIIESGEEETQFTTLQLKAKFTASSNTAPQIESAGIFLK
ncbi:MAG TPA: hypothetical protein ENI23_12345 [bacterium]|nr:hypothetical protein [bacterium]